MRLSFCVNCATQTSIRLQHGCDVMTHPDDDSSRMHQHASAPARCRMAVHGTAQPACALTALRELRPAAGSLRPAACRLRPSACGLRCAAGLRARHRGQGTGADISRRRHQQPGRRAPQAALCLIWTRRPISTGVAGVGCMGSWAPGGVGCVGHSFGSRSGPCLAPDARRLTMMHC